MPHSRGEQLHPENLQETNQMPFDNENHKHIIRQEQEYDSDLSCDGWWGQVQSIFFVQILVAQVWNGFFTDQYISEARDRTVHFVDVTP